MATNGAERQTAAGEGCGMADTEPLTSADTPLTRRQFAAGLARLPLLSVAAPLAIPVLAGCAGRTGDDVQGDANLDTPAISGKADSHGSSAAVGSSHRDSSAASASASQQLAPAEFLAREQELRDQLGVVLDLRESLSHGDKGPDYQRYIVLHDTDDNGDPEAVVSYWDESARGIAAHFVVGRDGLIVQCVPLEEIAHHAGYGDTGHNELFGVPEDGRDDKGAGAGDYSQPLGPDYADYGMNAYSVGIELVHHGDPGETYEEEQLVALDGLIALIDSHFAAAGCEPSAIIDHKAWRTTNPDTSPEFADYLTSYQQLRRHAAE